MTKSFNTHLNNFYLQPKNEKLSFPLLFSVFCLFIFFCLLLFIFEENFFSLLSLCLLFSSPTLSDCFSFLLSSFLYFVGVFLLFPKSTQIKYLFYSFFFNQTINNKTTTTAYTKVFNSN